VIARTWSGRVPDVHSANFHAHLLRTGVADYRKSPGCHAAWVWRRRDVELGWTRFVLVSVWDTDADAERYAHAHGASEAVLYPGDGAFGLDPDKHVVHYDILAGGFERPGEADPRRVKA
jgi:quinol monooxygenase YgiN